MAGAVPIPDDHGNGITRWSPAENERSGPARAAARSAARRPAREVKMTLWLPLIGVAGAGRGFYKLVVCRTGEATLRGAARPRRLRRLSSDG